MRTLDGHRGAVRALAYLPDGRLVSAGQDGRVLLYRPGQPADLLHKSPRPVYALAVRPDGRRLAVGGRLITRLPLNPVTLLDPDTGHTTHTLQCTVVEPAIVLYPVPPVPTPAPAPRSVWSLSWSGDGQLLAAAVRRPGGANMPEGGGGRWWNLSTGRDRPLPHDAFAVRFAPAGPGLAISRRERVEFRLTPDEERADWRLTPSATWAADIAFSPAGDRVVVASGSFLYLLDRLAAKPRRLKTGLRIVTSLAMIPDGRAVMAGGYPGGVEIYDLAGGKLAGYDFGLGLVHAVAVAPDGLTAAVGGDGGLAVFDL